MSGSLLSHQLDEPFILWGCMKVTFAVASKIPCFHDFDGEIGESFVTSIKINWRVRRRNKRLHALLPCFCDLQQTLQDTGGAFCFYSFCLECCERSQCLIAPTRLNITRLCCFGTYSFPSSFSTYSTNRSSSTTSLCTVP